MREIFIERREKILRIAIKENGKLQECMVEEEKTGPVIGEIYKGRVKNIILATNSIFVDLGLEKDGYLYYSNDLKKKRIKKGDEIVVEVIKESLGDKGPKLTTNFSISSKYMVIEKYGSGIEFSKRFKDEIKKEIILAEIKEVSNAKLIIRTDAANVSMEELEYERNMLVNEYEEINRKLKFSNKLGKIYGENISLNRVLREKIGTSKTKVIIDSKKDYDFAKEYLKNQENVKIQLFEDARGVFELYSIESELIKLRHNKMVLNCGGSIVINKTEAMYVIDVNTGQNIKEKNFEITILETNVEAAREIGRQILLRNLSGIIVIDFIDQREKSNKGIVMRELKESLKEDVGNIMIFPFTELNLVQISRKRRGKSIYEYMEEECPLCNGQGRLLKFSYIEGLIHNEMLKYSNENGINDFLIELDDTYKEKVKEDIVSFLTSINGFDKKIYINYIAGMEGYRVEPLIFQNQKKNIEKYLITI